MKILDKFVKKYADTAGKAVGAGVKKEIVAGVSSALPVIIGLGTIVLGLATCKSGGHAKSSGKSAIRTMTVITNNYFLDSAMKDDVLTKMMK